MLQIGISFTTDFSAGTRGRNRSYQSLQDIDWSSVPISPYDTLTSSSSKDKLRKQSRSTGRAEYIGLALPVDITMIFQVSFTSIMIHAPISKLE